MLLSSCLLKAGMGWVGVMGLFRGGGGGGERVYVYVCVYTQHAKIPQPDEANPGTCNARLRRKFHILPYHRTSISSLALDVFQKFYNCCCCKWVESMWKWRPAGVFFSCYSPHVWHHGAFMFFIHTHTDNATLRSRLWRGRPCCHWLANVFVSSVCVGKWFKLLLLTQKLCEKRSFDIWL